MEKRGVDSIQASTLIYQQGNVLNLQGYITIPCINESQILPIISLLKQCNPNYAILLFINASVNADSSIYTTNIELFNQVVNKVKRTTCNVFIGLNNEIPAKYAGVGFARKYIMDTAASLAYFRHDAWISGLDADCYIANDYVFQLNKYFLDNPTIQACSIGFEHQPAENMQMQRAIDLYQMHLRYLKLGLWFANFPFYHHTIGSSMACRAHAYGLVGGMNTRQAGEDFYFLQKLMPLGFGNLAHTLVYPSARISTRVPFGTGRAMANIAANTFESFYPFQVFEWLKDFMNCLALNLNQNTNHNWQWYAFNNSIALDYFETKKLSSTWQSLNKNSKTIQARNKKMMQWLSGNVVFLLLNKWRASLPLVSNQELEVIKLLQAMQIKSTPLSLSQQLQMLDLKY